MLPPISLLTCSMWLTKWPRFPGPYEPEPLSGGSVDQRPCAVRGQVRVSAEMPDAIARDVVTVGSLRGPGCTLLGEERYAPSAAIAQYGSCPSGPPRSL